MSYIPDYRHERDKLNEFDKRYIEGWRDGVNALLNVFNNLDVYEVTADEEKVLNEFKECAEHWAIMDEIDRVAWLFEQEEYGDIELTDAREPLYKNH